ncbi:unnamed protein product [Lactuca saligna]|uniref:Replication factor A C-terminal domain-containing protein n=1 Tax=Lactuca saligna TaxID=75948 RepID=A0AA35UPV9_LACSI|nr:unnamed protein product [Lactuca saligna]
MRVIKDNARETRLMSMIAQDMSGRKMQLALWDGFALKLNSYIPGKAQYLGCDGEPLNCDGSGGVSDVYDKVRVVIRVEDENGSASFVLFDHHDQGRQKIPDEFNIMLNRKFVFKVQISKFNLQNNYHGYTVNKMIDDELVVVAVFKHSPAYEEDNIHSDVTLTTTSLKRPIEIVTTSESFECSCSKDGITPHTLKL